MKNIALNKVLLLGDSTESSCNSYKSQLDTVVCPPKQRGGGRAGWGGGRATEERGERAGWGKVCRVEELE